MSNTLQKRQNIFFPILKDEQKNSAYFYTSPLNKNR